jgi:hypothetical protein
LPVAFCLLHGASGVGVAFGHLDAFEVVDGESVAQEAVGFFHRREGFERSFVTAVAGSFSSLFVEDGVGLGAGPMVVQIRVEMVSVEAVDGFGVGLVDVSVADVFADDPAVFGLDQAVVAALPRTAFGLLDLQLVEKMGGVAIDKLAAVVGVKAEDAERELAQHSLQDR